MTSDPVISVGIRAPYGLLEGDVSEVAGYVSAAERAGIDRIFVGDHVTFKGGQGFDGLIQATALAVLSRGISVQTAVYLLPLRHPVAVARQIASLSALAPGRFILGVGVGGDDRDEVRACGVDPSTRGARMDESLPILRALLTGEPVSRHGEHFSIDEVQILPAPNPQVPIVVGGRTDAAVRRVAHHGDGWLGVWVSARRYVEVCRQIAESADATGRTDVRWQHGMHVWCGFGASADEARTGLATSMESFYRVPFEKFAPYSPAGTPADIAEALRPYVEAGCRSFNLIAGSGDEDRIFDGVSEIRALLSAAIA
jgi:alkanesulfonate monooxygenase SsuD/methylene tetrahydromethanopterin reductase-like flavin-dependent oxidoreductase (luciferase family)